MTTPPNLTPEQTRNAIPVIVEVLRELICQTNPRDCGMVTQLDTITCPMTQTGPISTPTPANLSSEPRMMQANVSYPGNLHHGFPHKWNFTCDYGIPCVPVSPDSGDGQCAASGTSTTTRVCSTNTTVAASGSNGSFSSVPTVAAVGTSAVETDRLANPSPLGASPSCTVAATTISAADLPIGTREYPTLQLTGDKFSDDNLLVFLEQAGAGCISGAVVEWPQLKPACKWAAATIERLTAERDEWKRRYEHQCMGTRRRMEENISLTRERDDLRAKLAAMTQPVAEAALLAVRASSRLGL